MTNPSCDASAAKYKYAVAPAAGKGQWARASPFCLMKSKVDVTEQQQEL